MQAWLNFLALQESDLGPETVQKWLRTLKILRWDACNLYLEAKDSFQTLWFEEHIRQKILTKLVNNNNKRIKVHLSIANSNPKANYIKSPKVKKSEKENPLKFIPSFDKLDPYCTFDHFVVTEKNLLPYKLFSQLTGYSSQKSLQTKPELSVFNPIFVYGPSGTGKTHMLMAAAHELRTHNLNVVYTRAETFTEHVVTAIRAGEMSLFRQAYRNIDVLILDDVHVLSRKGATQEELFHTFNALHMSGKQIILSAICSPAELQYIEPRLVSRFEWGIVLPLEPPAPEETRKILQNKAEALNYPLHNKVIDFLMETFTSNGKKLNRALEALILRLHLGQNAGRITQGPLTVPLSKSLLGDLIAEEQQAALTPAKIIHVTAEFFGIRAEDILGKSQSRDCVLPRQIAMHLCRSQLKMPFIKIGDLFNRDHSTVMSSVKMIQKGIDENIREISGAYHTLLKKVKS